MNQMKGEHFIIPSTREVPRFMRDAMWRFEGRDIEARVLDIEGCYPNMPKEVIRFAMRAIVQEARQEGRGGVSVPTRSKKRKPTWKRVDGGPYKWISFEILLDALDFALDNAVFALVGPLYSRLWRSARPLSGAEGFRYGSLASPALLLCRLWLTQQAPPGRGGPPAGMPATSPCHCTMPHAHCGQFGRSSLYPPPVRGGCVMQTAVHHRPRNGLA